MLYLDGTVTAIIIIMRSLLWSDRSNTDTTTKYVEPRPNSKETNCIVLALVYKKSRQVLASRGLGTQICLM